MERREEILAAMHELQRHGEDLDEIADDEEALDDFCLRLFEEECFAPFRFAAADIFRAPSTL